MRFTSGLILAFAVASAAFAAPSGNVPEKWTAHWISPPAVPAGEYGVYHFRRAFDLPARPSSFVVHVSGDNRYQLFVNGRRAALGPARGDLNHWRYETVDLAPFLKAGRNVLAALVWNFGPETPVAQISYRTGFLVQGHSEAERAADTGKEWKCFRNPAYSPVAFESPIPVYYVTGPGDQVDGSRYPWGWETPQFEDAGWSQAVEESEAAPRDHHAHPHTHWMLIPSPIPPEEQVPERLSRVRQSSGITAPAGFPAKAAAFEVPANTKVRLLLDQDRLTTAYPELTVSGGRGTRITLRYAEALFPGLTLNKGNRDEVEGKQFYGNSDVFLADGGAHRLFRPLWWRTYRYLELNAETGAEPLTIEDLRGVFTGYPFQRAARFEADSPELQRILDVGWHTARLCAHETYMDCPYYEQLQYAGDTRIQALVSLYMTGDGRLMRNAIELLNDSRTSEGATFSRAPSALQQYIPPFSLWWIGMVHDYWMYQDDPALVKQVLPGVEAVLSFFAAYQKQNSSLAGVPWWSFVDWVDQWDDGVPPHEADGSTAPLDLQLLLAHQWAARMEAALGSKALTGEYEQSARRLQQSIRQLYWRADRKMFSDRSGGDVFSQHTNSLAVLAGVTEGEEARGLLDRVVKDKSLAPASIYFRYYLHCALSKAGLGDRYLDMLGPWRNMLGRGLTTWSETEDPVRSDCHAWGASPNIELFRTVLGIDSAAPGFRKVVVRPALGKLTKVSGTMPHPKGEVAVSLALRQGKLEADVRLPAGTEGEFIWHDSRKPLQPGTNHLVF